MSQPLQQLRFLLSATDARQLPASEVEVAFVGRSNVGKSSLLNAVAVRKQLARVSRTPGRTRLINVFEAAPGRWIVDLPGYGFAKGSAKERSSWQAMIEGYLRPRASLRTVFVLVDAEIGPTPLDLQMLEWLDSIGVPSHVVANKADKVGKSRHESRRAAIARELGRETDDVSWVSAEKGLGLLELRRLVGAQLGLSGAERAG